LLEAQETKVIVEVGPHSALAGPLREIFAAEKDICDDIVLIMISVNCCEVDQDAKAMKVTGGLH
jgi:hypothetical protein